MRSIDFSRFDVSRHAAPSVQFGMAMGMNRIGLGAAILLASTLGALAADLPVKYKAPPPDPWSWNGLYGGINAGYSFGRDTFKQDFNGLPQDPAGRALPTGGVFGGQLGYNWQVGRWVLGLEGDAQWTGQRDRGCGGFECIQNYNDEVGAGLVEHKLEWFTTARARLGLANAGYLLYVTGGGAWAGVRETTTAQLDDSIGSTAVRNVLTGWALGGGIETRLSQNWSVKVEYLHLDFSPTTTTTRLVATGGVGPFDLPNTTYSHITDNIARVGLNYRLWSTPAAAPLPVDPAAAAWRWTGFYGGLNGGYGVGNTSFKEFKYFDPATPPLPLELTHYVSSFAPQKVSPQGGLAGGQVGYNWQFDHLVVGVEGDAQWSGQKDTACAMSCFTAGGSIETLTQQFNWLATARARVGYADRGYLLYLTAGGAWAEIEESDFFTGSGPSFTSNFKQTKGGWVAGGGIEAWLFGNWTGKIEYLHLDLGTINHSFPTGEVFFTSLGSQSHIRNDIVRVGVNYKLGGG
jgi:outer membrane immunogenic protein